MISHITSVFYVIQKNNPNFLIFGFPGNGRYCNFSFVIKMFWKCIVDAFLVNIVHFSLNLVNLTAYKC